MKKVYTEVWLENRKKRDTGIDYYFKIDRVHSGFIWSRAESSHGTNLLSSLNLTRRGICFNNFTGVDIHLMHSRNTSIYY